MDASPTIGIRQLDNYRFEIDFGPLIPALAVDEAPPYGGGEGPFPEQILIAGVTNCLCASLVFALAKHRQQGGGVSAEARCQLARNAEGRLRIVGIEVDIALGATAAEMDRIERVMEQFERFCTVSESVKAGVPVAVSVRDGVGTRLK